MTSGTIVRDYRVVAQYYDWDSSTTPNYMNVKDVLVGQIWSKTWSGTDYPHTKPVYEKFRFFYGGKFHTVKFRQDKPTRAKIDYHPYSCTIEQVESNISHYNRYTYGVLSQMQNHDSLSDLGGCFYPANEWDANDDIALIGKLREKIAGSDFNAGVFLREGGESLKLITDSATRIFKALRYVKHGDVVSAAKQLFIKDPQRFSTVSRALKRGRKDLSGAWLELQYGWLPIIKDAQGAAEFLAKTLEYPMIQTYRVRKTKNQTYSWNPSNMLDKQGSCVTTGQLIARLEEVDVYKLSGLTDPASVIWEAMPWSFVADWFIPVGNYLAARGLANALTGTFVKTLTRRLEFECGGFAANTSGLFGITGSYSAQPKRLGYTISVTRTVSSSLQVPLPTWKPLGKVASWQHCANAVALLTQKFF